MKYLKKILAFFILTLLITTSKYSRAQKLYYFENIKTGKSYRMGQSSLCFELNLASTDTNIIKIYKKIYCSIDSFSENQLFISKSKEIIEIYLKDNEVQTAVNSYTKKGHMISYSFKDSILINDIIKVSDRSGYYDRYKLVTGLSQVVGVSLGLVTLVGPFVFNDYFKVVGISFVSAIPVFITTAILQNRYILNGRKPGKKEKWRMVYR